MSLRPYPLFNRAEATTHESKSDSNPGDIEQIRDDIDRIDADILKLLAERKAHSLRIAKEKGIHDRPSRDQSREEALRSPTVLRPGWSTISTRVW